MDDESRRARIRRLVEAINTQEMEPFDAIYHDDVVIEWPQIHFIGYRRLRTPRRGSVADQRSLGRFGLQRRAALSRRSPVRRRSDGSRRRRATGLQ